jgi:hypothetical protein
MRLSFNMLNTDCPADKPAVTTPPDGLWNKARTRRFAYYAFIQACQVYFELEFNFFGVGVIILQGVS